jgi:hypothetical protein
LDDSTHGLNIRRAGLEQCVDREKRAIGREIESRAAETDIGRTSSGPFGPMILACNELERARRPVKDSVAVAIDAFGRLIGSNAALKCACGTLTSPCGGFAGGDGREIRTDARVNDGNGAENWKSGPMMGAGWRLDGRRRGLRRGASA